MACRVTDLQRVQRLRDVGLARLVAQDRNWHAGAMLGLHVVGISLHRNRIN